MTIEAFSKIHADELIDEIVIVDDCSEKEHWIRLLELIDSHPSNEKIHVFRNEKNLNMSRNKAEAVSKAKNEWVILLDSDNILYPEYLDSIKPYILSEETSTTIMQPAECESEYTFKQFEGMTINKDNAKDFLRIREFRIMLNQCNYLVNRDKYLEVYQYNPEIRESDTIWFAYLWLKAGYSFFVVPGMVYHHRRHPGSGWLMGDHSYNMKKADELQNKIKNL